MIASYMIWFQAHANHAQKQQDPSMEHSSSESSEDDGDDESQSPGDEDDPNDPLNALIKASRQEASDRARADRKAKKRAAKAELEQIAKKRRNDVVNLNGLTSLSGKQEKKQQQIPAGISCYSCGGHHFKKDCPKSKRGHLGDDDGPPRKTLRQQ